MRYSYKKIILYILCIVFSLIPTAYAVADNDELVDITPVLNEVFDKTDLSAWQKFIDGNEYFNKYSGVSSPKEFILNLINNKSVIDTQNLINLIFDNFIASLKSHINYAVILIIIALISTLLEKLSNGFFTGKVSNFALRLLFLTSLAVIIKGFAESVGHCIDGIQKMTNFVSSSFPIFSVLISAVSSTSSQILQPSATVIVSLMSDIICNIVIPLLTISAVMSMCHCISEQKTFYILSENTKKIADRTIGIIFTVFLGFVSIQKLTSNSLDTLSLRTIRYTLSSFSTYGGAFLSKSFDIVTGCTVMLKNVIGGVGTLILLTLCLNPAIKLLCASLVYNIASFLISLTGESRISSCMTTLGRIYGTMFLCTVTSATLFFIIISAVSSIGNSIIGA